jgi:integrase
MSSEGDFVAKKRVKPNLRGVNEGLSPVAHNTVKSDSVDALDRAYNVLTGQLELVNRHGIEVKAVARLQLLYGLRISEVLAITGNDIDRFGSIWIVGQKKSNARQVIDTELIQFYLSKRLLCTGRVFEFDRFYIHRVYKSCGINHTANGYAKNLTTHYMRHLFVKRISGQTNDLVEMANVIGHKSKTNTKGYLDSKIK